MQPGGTQSMVHRISGDLRQAIETGAYAPGTRLPSEKDLTERYGVSRTVAREAFANLRADGLVESRKGAGVFVLERAPLQSPFSGLNVDRISSVIELLELRTVFEVEAAAFAAARRSASQLEKIIDAHRKVAECLRLGLSTRDADYDFHHAIAEATQNRRFPEFLQLIRSGIIPRGELQGAPVGERPRDYNLHLEEEHGRIVDAIIQGDSALARQYMADHLRGSMERYRALLLSRATRTDGENELPARSGGTPHVRHL
ncbi:FadR/GntR family transcriptional regulator [Phyllobacterium leguminum]|uniref:GntR family transcriptional regulator n=1 Tax=Phyllobacterium leguminum TaxID=314237 RepID=A0A318T4F4_9HYPH|nr:FadR/GntR family transcriptional regulator [Phyllobacterium leguminum]PYE87007.1 GntR family transcriptional regulator [Phyllobacterium leguminum]